MALVPTLGAAIPAHPSTKLPTAFLMRSIGTSAMSAPTPNCHMRVKVRKYAGAGFVMVKTTQKTKDARVTTPSVVMIARRRAPRKNFTPIHAASSMMSGHST